MMANQLRIEKHIDALSRFTKTPGEGVTRLTYSAEDLQARNYIKEKMMAYGLTVSEDGFGNIFGKLDGTIENAPSVLVGSHFDSVPHGGAYDGTAGVVIALEIAALFQEQQLQPAYPLEVIAMIEEEGTRFGGGLMGSRGMTGLLTGEEFSKLTDQAGTLAVDAMVSIGLDPSKNQVRAPETMKAFLELHIEQGPILEEKDVKVGIVDAIIGLTQLEVTVQGKAGHAGTTPMDRRSDALVAAAQMISEFPNIAIAESDDTVITTGKLQVFPNGANVIPDKVVFSVDIRSRDENHIVRAVQQVNALIDTKNKQGITTSVEQIASIAPKSLSTKVRTMLKQATDQLGISNCVISSGAGHDAMVLSDFTEAGMIFVPSRDGLSHCPEEFTEGADLVTGTNVVFEAVKELTGVIPI